MSAYGTGVYGTGTYGAADETTDPIPEVPDLPGFDPDDVGQGFPGRVLEGLGPAMRELAGALLPPLVHALTSELTRTDELLTAPDDALAAPPAFDLDLTPYPGWFAQIAGVVLPGGLSTEAAREYIRGRGVSRRGTPGALVAAARSTLTGGRRVDITERDGSPWRLLVRTYLQETPDPAATLAALLTEKPVGIVLTHEVVEGATYAHMQDVHGPTYADQQASFPLYRDTVTHAPEIGA